MRKKIFLVVIRLIAIFVVSIYIFIQLPPPKINSEELKKVQELNETKLILPGSIVLESTYPQNFEELIWRILFVNSKPDKICFENRGTFIQFEDGTTSNSVNVNISYNNQQPALVERIKCFDIVEDQTQFTFQWGFNAQIPINQAIEKGGTFRLHPDVKTYVVLSGFFGSVLTFICVFLFTGSLFWLWKGCFDFIKNGWFK